MEEFNVASVDLVGANIIEASAGTGKTFSIAVLVVRLLIEKGIPIEKMLLVTFTDAAAAELKERSIKFIREALLETEAPGSSGNDIIRKVVENTHDTRPLHETENILRQALLNIDRAMMCTIHSFCQQTLNEFAFETQQVFGKELKTDISDIVNKYTNAYRREVLNVMDPEVFEMSDLHLDAILNGAIKNALSGQRLYIAESCHVPVEEIIDSITVLNSEMTDYVEERLEEFAERVRNSTLRNFRQDSKEKLLKILENAEYTIDAFTTIDKFKIPELFPVEIQYCKERLQTIRSYERAIKEFCLQQAIDWILPKVKEEIQGKNHFTFDDLIDSLHEARHSEDLKQLLREKYDVIFLDEFQDTDKKQYAIFKDIFQQDAAKTMFYIGDPKQSIYAWRKADLNTYFEARNSIDPGRRFTMKTNFRSTTDYVSALNSFFLPHAAFDTFENGDVDESKKIKYEAVTADSQAAEGVRIKDNLLSPLTIIKDLPNEDEIKGIIKTTIRYLLQGDVTLNKTPLKPSDITILVRTNRQGKEVKKMLDYEKIPSVLLDDSKVAQSSEAGDLLFILQAILNPKKASIQKALLTTVFGKKIADLEYIDFDDLVEKFSTYRKRWEKDGVFVALNQVLNDFGIVEKHQTDSTQGQRILSNVRQLLELIQEKEQNNSLTPNETYFYLHRQTKSPDDSENKEFSQRIESDEDAVKIVTIHKSKGLEYNVVIAPYLNLTAEEIYEFSSIRLESVEEQEYIFVKNPIPNDLRDIFLRQQNQENRRLLYVALTRAKYNAIVLSKINRGDGHMLLPFLDHVTGTIPHLSLYKKEDIGEWDQATIELKQQTPPTNDLAIPNIIFADKNYSKMSYSFLSAHPSKSTKEDTTLYEKNEYDHFIFKDLKKGAQTGNLLHNIFEFINYSDTDNWQEVIRNSVQCFAPSMTEDARFHNNLYQLVHHTVHSSLGTDVLGESFSLTAVTRDKRVNEIEFYFKVKDEFSMMDLESVQTEHSQILTNRSGKVKGIMNGLVDLFFEHQGKYYILDWKSNFLGDSMAYYHQNQLNEAMNESNYHLQYCIYTVAMKRFLDSRLGDAFDYNENFGGVIYLFVRGTREGQNTGVYINKLPVEKLEELEQIFQLEAVGL